ncbi:MAG: RNA polymerase sigma factor [Christensenellales bacterium]
MAKLDSIFMNNYHLIFRIVYSYTKNVEDTKDILQDTFIRAYRASKEELLPGMILPWLIVIAKNTAKTFMKKKVVTEPLDDYSSVIAEDPEILTFTLSNALDGILNTVPQEVRNPLKIGLMEDVPLKRIAEEYKIPYSLLRYWNKKLISDMQSIMGE